VEQTSFAMESVRDTQTMVAAMQTAAKQLKVEHKKININQIEDMQDDLSGEDPFLSFSFLHVLYSHVSLYVTLVNALYAFCIS
jgi:Snf7